MAFSAIIPWSASPAAPLVVRVVECRSHKHPAVASAVYFAVRRASVSYQLRPTTCFSSRSISSTSSPRSPDERLLKVLQSEIDDVEQSEDYDKNVEVPEGFPFKVEDNVGKQTATLTREYGSETITVKVSLPNPETGEEGEDIDEDDEEDEDADEEEEDEEEAEDEEEEEEVGLALLVTIAKKDGRSLVFDCTAFQDEITINSISLKNPETDDQLAYEGPDFLELDENLQKAFHKYLSVRGIKPSTFDFVYEYMIEKDNREYHRWLKNVKQFVEA